MYEHLSLLYEMNCWAVLEIDICMVADSNRCRQCEKSEKSTVEYLLLFLMFLILAI